MAQVKKTLSTTKTFKYAQGAISLSFTINIDNKEELKSFRKCLQEALKDTEVELNKEIVK